MKNPIFSIPYGNTGVSARKPARKLSLRARLLGWVWLGVWAHLWAHLDPSPAHATGTEVLPKDRHRFKVVLGRTGEIRNTFDPDGNSVSLVAPYQLELSSRNFRRAEPRVSELVNFLNNLPYTYDVAGRQTDNGIRAAGSSGSLPPLGDALSRGSLGVDAFGQRNQWVLQFHRGITDQWTVGIVGQLIQQNLTLRTQIGGINTANDIYQYFSGPGGLGQLGQFADALGLLAQINSETFQNVLTSRGYERLTDQQESGWGDLILTSRYLWKSGDFTAGNLRAAFETRLLLPTGKLARPSQLTGLDFGSGAVSLLLGHQMALRPAVSFLKDFQFFHQFSVLQNFPYQRIRRIRTSEGDFLPDASTEEWVTVALGNSWTQSLGAYYSIQSWLEFAIRLDWMMRHEDKILTAGPNTGRGDYLTQSTDGELKTLQFQLSGSSVAAFFAGKWPFPSDFTLTWSQPLSGKNQIIAPYGLAELALYF